VRASITALSSWPTRALYNDKGQPSRRHCAARSKPTSASMRFRAGAPQYGLVVKRAALRTFPTRERVFSSVGDTDIDRFQESALFPGDKVAVVHRSADGRWLFVHSERYSAWIEADAIASGDKATVLGYGAKGPTGSSPAPPRRPPTPRKNRASRACSWTWACACRCWPTGRPPPVNGQQAHASWVVQLPVREADGR
jgi:hypothetical protein